MWSSFLAAKGICRRSASMPSAAFSDEMNFSTRLRIASSFSDEKSPEAETRISVTVSAASANGEGAFASASST